MQDESLTEKADRIRPPRLQQIVLNDTQVTDTGLEQLNGLTSLEELGLATTPVTNAGVAKLKQVLPRLRVYR